MENCDIINTDFKTALHGLGINSPIVPNRIPQGYVLNQINVYKDYTSANGQAIETFMPTLMPPTIRELAMLFPSPM